MLQHINGRSNVGVIAQSDMLKHNLHRSKVGVIVQGDMLKHNLRGSQLAQVEPEIGGRVVVADVLEGAADEVQIVGEEACLDLGAQEV